jgi:hypothetical protein
MPAGARSRNQACASDLVRLAIPARLRTLPVVPLALRRHQHFAQVDGKARRHAPAPADVKASSA